MEQSEIYLQLPNTDTLNVFIHLFNGSFLVPGRIWSSWISLCLSRWQGHHDSLTLSSEEKDHPQTAMWGALPSGCWRPRQGMTGSYSGRQPTLPHSKFRLHFIPGTSLLRASIFSSWSWSWTYNKWDEGQEYLSHLQPSSQPPIL